MNDQLDLDDLFARHLASTPLTIRQGALDTVVVTGRRRVRRRRAVISGFAASALVITGAVVVPRFGDSGNRVIVGAQTTTTFANVTSTSSASPSSTSGTSAAPAQVSRVGDDASLAPFGRSTLVWKKAGETTEDLPETISRQADGSYLGLFYNEFEPFAVDANGAPILNAFRQEIYTSDDAVRWTKVDTPSNVLPTAAARIGKGLMVVGGVESETTDAHKGDIVVLESKADGSWSRVVLPMNLSDLAARGAEVASSATVARRGDATIVVVSSNVAVDVGRRIPVDAPSHSGWGVSGTGVDLYAPFVPVSEACSKESADLQAGGETPPLPTSIVAIGEWYPPSLSAGCLAEFKGQNGQPYVKSYTFAELGVDPVVIGRIGSTTKVFLSVHGGPFVENTVPLRIVGPFDSIQAFATANGFILMRNSLNATGAFSEISRSADGQEWSEIEHFEGMAGELVDRHGELTAIVGDPVRRSVTGDAIVTVGATTARRTPASPQLSAFLNFNVNSRSIGGYGFAGMYQSPVGASGPASDSTKGLIVDSADGIEWRATSVGDLVDPETAKNVITTRVWVDDRGLIVNVVLSNGTPGVVAKTITFVGRPRE
jgi:hypothetical protein